MAKLSKIRNFEKEITVNIGEETIKAQVLPNKWTGEFVESMQKNIREGQGGFLAEMIAETVSSWDLMYDPESDIDDEGKPLYPDADGKPMTGVIPLDAKTLHKIIPTTVMGEIMGKIHEAMNPSPKTSSFSGSFS